MTYVSTGMGAMLQGLNLTDVNLLIEKLVPKDEQVPLLERLLIIEDEYLAINAEDRD